MKYQIILEAILDILVKSGINYLIKYGNLHISDITLSQDEKSLSIIISKSKPRLVIYYNAYFKKWESSYYNSDVFMINLEDKNSLDDLNKIIISKLDPKKKITINLTFPESSFI